VAVRIRLRRSGKKKMPMYHIVAADSRAARDGKFIEAVGRYEPLEHPIRITLNEGRVMYWLKSGARPTDTVRSLFQRTGLWLRWSLTQRGLDAAAIATEMEKWQMMQAEKQAREDARKARRATNRKKAAKGSEPAPGAAEPAPAAQTS
jgi:small subunit ribosomal protein S16